jgi:hypothetical protein
VGSGLFFQRFNFLEEFFVAVVCGHRNHPAVPPSGFLITKNEILAALKRAKVMETIAGRVAVGFVCFLHALGHYLSGGVLVVGAFFFFSFTIHTNRLVIDDR